jgi:lipoprotein Spr
MRKLFHLYFISSVALLGGCKAFKNAAAKDNSVSQTKKNSITDNNMFLEDISVTPGSKRTIVSKSSDSKKTYGVSDALNKTTKVESASDVQLKYSSILDVPVEELSNMRLLLNIEYWWGTKYCLGGSTEDCTDCSAFTQNIMRDVYSLTIPRTAQEQYNNSMRIKTKELQQGDLVFFQNSHHRVTHVGIYVTNNKFAHASVSNGVMISDLDDEYWKKRFKGAGRVLK